jgi:hypothetical protein
MWPKLISRNAGTLANVTVASAANISCSEPSSFPLGCKKALWDRIRRHSGHADKHALFTRRKEDQDDRRLDQPRRSCQNSRRSTLTYLFMNELVGDNNLVRSSQLSGTAGCKESRNACPNRNRVLEGSIVDQPRFRFPCSWRSRRWLLLRSAERLNLNTRPLRLTARNRAEPHARQGQLCGTLTDASPHLWLERDT